MRDLIDEYGMTIVAAVVIIMLIVFAGVLKGKEANILGGIGSQQAIKMQTKNKELSSNMIEVEQKISSYRNKNSEIERSYEKIVQMYENDIKSFEQSTSWQRPIKKNEITGDFMYYKANDINSGVHLGVDYAATEGSDVVAPSNGVIFISSDGCDKGFLGDKCSGRDENAVSYGGNQIYFVTIHDNKMFVFTFSHLKRNTVHGYGYVKQGEKIGEVGSTGNSTGPHSHIEAYYLGLASRYDNKDGTNTTDGERIINFLNSKTTASFGCGWGTSGLLNIDTADNESGLTTPFKRFNPNILFKNS